MLPVSANLRSARKLLKKRKSRFCQIKRDLAILTVIQAARSQSTGTTGKQNCLSVDRTLVESTSKLLHTLCCVYIYVFAARL